jgi:hypothetical protein
LPRANSMTFFAAPIPGKALSPVSSTPLITPFRLMVATTVAAAIAAPRIGIERDTRRESRAEPHRVSRLLIVMPAKVQVTYLRQRPARLSR